MVRLSVAAVTDTVTNLTEQLARTSHTVKLKVRICAVLGAVKVKVGEANATPATGMTLVPDC